MHIATTIADRRSSLTMKTHYTFHEPDARMVKIFKRIESVPVMMNTRDEEYPMGATVGIRYRASESKTAASE